MFRGNSPTEEKPISARVVFDHYLPSHSELARYHELLDATDRLDSAQLELSDIERQRRPP